MQPISFRPTKTTFHRYKPEEMSGPLPPVLYKILPEIYARRLVQGETLWSTLTWFQNEEDQHRGDGFEGSLRHFPVKGLEVTRKERNGRPDHAKFTLDGHGTVAIAAQSHHIFIYSMTLDPTLAIGDPSDRACVEIFDTKTFAQRVLDAIKRHRSARPQTFIHDVVRYWDSENPPSDVGALPHRLTLHKHKTFEAQAEYRFAFGTRANVFDYENVDYSILEKDFQRPRLTLDPQSHRMKIRLGSLENCCRLLER